jgi:hypothetical protein
MTTKRDKAEFRMYCERCTDIQLRNVLARETLARRTAYVQIAREVMTTRGRTELLHHFPTSPQLVNNKRTT